MHYVRDEYNAQAREFEQRFAKLPTTAGVLFVSVRAIPTETGHVKTFEVRLGIARHLEEDTGLTLIKHVLEEEVKKGELLFPARVFRGIACHHAQLGKIAP